jgi:hypothetical protein
MSDFVYAKVEQQNSCMFVIVGWRIPFEFPSAISIWDEHLYPTKMEALSAILNCARPK